MKNKVLYILLMLLFVSNLFTEEKSGGFFGLFKFTPPAKEDIVVIPSLPYFYKDTTLPTGKAAYYQFEVGAVNDWYIESYGKLDTSFKLFDKDWKEVAKADDSDDSKSASLSLPLTRGTYYLEVKGYLGSGGEYSLFLYSRKLLDSSTTEANNDASKATLLSYGEPLIVTDSLEFDTDYDYYHFQLPDKYIGRNATLEVQIASEGATKVIFPYREGETQKNMTAFSDSYKTKITLSIDNEYTFSISGAKTDYTITFMLIPEVISE